MSVIHRVLTEPASPTPDDIYLVKQGDQVLLGVANVTGSALLSLETPLRLEGPDTLFHAEIGTYTLKDYTDQQTYVLSSSSGLIDREGDQITFQVLDAELTSANFTVNGQVFTITIVNVVPDIPSITTPAMDQEGVPISGFTIQASDFVMTDPLDSSTHASSDWQVATDIGFENVVFSSSNDAVNKTSITLP